MSRGRIWTAGALLAILSGLVGFVAGRKSLSDDLERCHASLQYMTPITPALCDSDSEKVRRIERGLAILRGR